MLGKSPSAILRFAGLLIAGAAALMAFQNCTPNSFSGDGEEPGSQRSVDGYPYDGKTYVRRDPACPDGSGIRTRVRYRTMDLAEVLKEACSDLAAPTPIDGTQFEIDPASVDILIYNSVTHHAEVQELPTPPTISMAGQSASTIARGQVLTITHNFLAAPMSADFTIFVNFVNSDGVSIFFDNHAPPSPTSVWSGPVSYSRAVTIPATVAVGTYKIVAGIYLFNPVSGQYENQAVLSGANVVVDGAPGNFQIGTVLVQ